MRRKITLVYIEEGQLERGGESNNNIQPAAAVAVGADFTKSVGLAAVLYWQLIAGRNLKCKSTFRSSNERRNEAAFAMRASWQHSIIVIEFLFGQRHSNCKYTHG